MTIEDLVKEEIQEINKSIDETYEVLDTQSKDATLYGMLTAISSFAVYCIYDSGEEYIPLLFLGSIPAMFFLREGIKIFKNFHKLDKLDDELEEIDKAFR